MSIDIRHIGDNLPAQSMTIERGRLVAFAKATGQTDRTYVDLGQAAAAGHADLPVPPTFLFAIELAAPDPFGWLSDLGVDLTAVLHGEQRFDYYRLAHAGERLTASPWIEDIYSKRDGALEFIVKRTAVSDENERPVAELTSVILVQNKLVRS